MACAKDMAYIFYVFPQCVKLSSHIIIVLKIPICFSKFSTEKINKICYLIREFLNFCIRLLLQVMYLAVYL